MNAVEEARARIAIADFEERLQEKRAMARRQKWSVAQMILQPVLWVGLLVWYEHYRPPIRDMVPVVISFLGATAYRDYQIREELSALRAQIEKLTRD
jgi:hypothetical protein